MSQTIERIIALLVTALCAAVFTAAVFTSAGCAPQVDLIEPGTPTRLSRDTVAYIWVQPTPGHWVESAKPVLLPRGSDILPYFPLATRPAQ